MSRLLSCYLSISAAAISGNDAKCPFPCPSSGPGTFFLPKALFVKLVSKSLRFWFIKHIRETNVLRKHKE